jgi:hypothetical protein
MLMGSLPFLFSNENNWRLSRHITFWVLWFVFQLILYSFVPSPLLEHRSFGTRILLTAPDTFFYLLPSLFLAYSLMDWVIPKLLLPGRYAWTFICVLLLFVATAGFSAFLSFTVVDMVRNALFGRVDPLVAAHPQLPIHVRFGFAMLAGLRGSITIGGLAASIRLVKYYSAKQQLSLQLEKEKIGAELQMLKAQLHPHFLFNTLNNIYSHTQAVSETASGMIMNLSALLRYMLYECVKPLVLLQDELSMIKDYLALEQSRYGNELDIVVSLPENTGNLQIAPLMLLPFVENSIKHGANCVLENPWISLTVSVYGQQLDMKLINGKDPGADDSNAGIGIANVRKRLDLLYPHQHELTIVNEEDVYVVNLSIKLILAGKYDIKEPDNEQFQKI